jgi:hypothetical protein
VTFILRRRTRRELEAEEVSRRAVAPGAGRDLGNRTRADVTERPRPLVGGATQAGQPLADEDRHDLEGSFGVDLSRVRVRPRDQRVSERGARAETRGLAISFAPGAYTPHNLSGRGLLAHELAHVLQQASAGQVVTASQKTPAVKVYYQEVVEEFRSTWGPHEAAVRPILALFEAVDRDDSAAVPGLVTALGKVDGYVLRTDFPSNAVLDELLTRLVLLGQADQASRVRRWYVDLPGVRPLGNQRWGRRYFDDEEWHWATVIQGLRERVDWNDAKATLRVLDAMAAFFHLLEAERAGLDAEEIKQDRKRVNDLYQSNGGIGVGFETKPFISIARYHGSLLGMMRDSFVGMQAAFQAVLELATADLAANKGRALLDQLEAKHTNVMAKLQLPAGDDQLEINEWKWRKLRGKDVLRQVDFFPDDKKAAKREITLESYDSLTTTSGPEKDIDIHRIFDIRNSQLGAIKRIYGIETEKGQLTAEAKENKAALAATGANGLQLHDDEDWRRFLLAKFQAHLTTSMDADESLTAVIQLLQVYLRSFTTHSPMNIEDLGDDLLRVDFPRALTGQLIHDCGVYALRITYMLSLLRNHPALKLRFRFVQLPVHIGLIVTGAPDISTWIVHNDQFSRGDPQTMEDTRKKWDALDRSGQERPKPAPGSKPTAGAAKPARPTKAEDDQFLGELSANEFAEGADMPFVLSDVPQLSGKSENVDKSKLTAFYRSLMTIRLFGKTTDDPKSPAFQYHLRYLELLDKSREHHNTWLVPFWNKLGFTAWDKSKARLEKADATLSTAATPDARAKAISEFDAATAAYLNLPVGERKFTVTTGLAKIVEQFAPIQKLAKDINDEIQAKPDILAKGVSKASAARASEALGGAKPWWQRRVDKHIDALKTHVMDEPPYAEEKNALSVVD